MELRNQDKETSMGSYNHHQLNLQEESHRPARDPDPIGRATAGSANAVIPVLCGTVSRSPPLPQPPPATRTAANVIPSSLSSVRYKECVRNHAASMGGHVMDGCGEFMPRGEEGTPEALICAACECHRNFHRREVDGESQHTTSYYNNGQRNLLPPSLQLPNSLPLLHRHQRYSHGVSMGTNTTIATPITIPAAPVMMSFGGGVAAESSSEDLNIYQSNLDIKGSTQESKKRFRTKFSHQQKEKMMEFAEKLGWRIQKQDEQEVQQFCFQVGVKRKIFKVWMHNNKQTMKKKQT